MFANDLQRQYFQKNPRSNMGNRIEKARKSNKDVGSGVVTVSA